MTSTPTPEQFLAMSDLDEDDVEPPAFDEQYLGQLQPSPFDWPNGPLESIAASLRQLVGTIAGHTEEERVADGLRESLDDLEAKHHVLFQLVEEIEAIIKPSTSKLANTVREAIARWRDPQAAAPETTEHPVEPGSDKGTGVPAAVQCGACRRYFVDEDLLEQHACTATPSGPPANDAGVEVWREYARSLGHDVSDQVNRSQIRTLLGLPHA